MKFPITGILILPFLFSSCGDEPEEISTESVVPTENIPKAKPVPTAAHVDMPEYNYVVFGTYAGECRGNCAPMFRYDLDGKGEQLLADTNNSFFDADRKIKFTVIVKNPNSINRADSVFLRIPREILEANTSRKYGCPDCTDGGGVYFEISKNNTVHKFALDPHDSTLDPQIKEFTHYIQKLTWSLLL